MVAPNPQSVTDTIQHLPSSVSDIMPEFSITSQPGSLVHQTQAAGLVFHTRESAKSIKEKRLLFRELPPCLLNPFEDHATFQDLPMEIRIMIWKETMANPRIVVVNLMSNQRDELSKTHKMKFISPTPVSPLLQLCKEARSEALRAIEGSRKHSGYLNHHVKAFATRHFEANIYIDFAHDTICFGAWTYPPGVAGENLNLFKVHYWSDEKDFEKIQRLVLPWKEFVQQFCYRESNGFKLRGLKEVLLLDKWPTRTLGEWHGHENLEFVEGRWGGTRAQMKAIKAMIIDQAKLCCPAGWVPPVMTCGILVRGGVPWVF